MASSLRKKKGRTVRLGGRRAGLHTNAFFGLAGPAEFVTSEMLLRAASHMHRGPAQYLANALVQLRLCERYLHEDPSYARSSLQQSLGCTQAALDSVRAMIRMLRCPSWGTPRIASLFRTLVEELRAFGRAEFCVNVDNVGPLPPAVEAGLATVGCEALTNAARHAAARRIAVNLLGSEEAVILDVVDDGRGFDYPEVLRHSAKCGRMGLALMREQVHALGGTLHIERPFVGGTHVRAVVPRFWLPVHGLIESYSRSSLARPY